jgi:hypothetical protein
LADYSLVTLGALQLVATDVEIGALPRTIGLACNPLAAEPKQTFDYVSGYQPVKMRVRLTGVDTTGETAANHLQRQLANLAAEAGKATNTLVIQVWGMADPYNFTVYKNEDFARPITPLVQSRSVMDVELTLNCLPA